MSDDWTTLWDDGVVFPFVEDENANITGLGWQNKQEFADAINAYDRACDVGMQPDDEWTADWISHRYAVLRDDTGDERMYTTHDGAPVGPESPGAVKITTLWNSR